MNDPILITGCARSGTSMVAGVIHACGAWGGEMSRGNRHNPKGMFENKAIRNEVLKPYLSSLGADPMGQDPLPCPQVINNLAACDGEVLRRDILHIIHSQGYKEGPFFYKGAKLCLVWQVVNNAFPHAHWVIVRRPREDIVDSCLRTPFMRAFNDRQGWAAWVEAHVARFDAMKKVVNWIEVNSPELVRCRAGYARLFVEHLGLSCNDELVDSFISKDLFHQ